MAELFNHVFDLDCSQSHQLPAHMVTRMDQNWLLASTDYLASTNHRFSLRVWCVCFTCLPYLAPLSLGGLPRVTLLLLLVHHMHNNTSNHSTYCIWLTAHDERYEILFAFSLPTTQHYYWD